MKQSVIHTLFTLFFSCDLISKTLTLAFSTGFKSTKCSHVINFFPNTRLPSSLLVTSSEENLTEEVTALDDLTTDGLKDEIDRLNTNLEDTVAYVEEMETRAQQVEGKADSLEKEFEVEASSNGDLVTKLLKEIGKGKDKLANRVLRFVDELEQSKER